MLKQVSGSLEQERLIRGSLTFLCHGQQTTAYCKDCSQVSRAPRQCKDKLVMPSFLTFYKLGHRCSCPSSIHAFAVLDFLLLCCDAKHQAISHEQRSDDLTNFDQDVSCEVFADSDQASMSGLVREIQDGHSPAKHTEGRIL